jgi:hypothetical protein
MIYNYHKMYYYEKFMEYYKYIINYIKKYIFGNDYRYYLFSILISITYIIMAIIYINKFLVNIKEKIA